MRSGLIPLRVEGHHLGNATTSMRSSIRRSVQSLLSCCRPDNLSRRGRPTRGMGTHRHSPPKSGATSANIKRAMAITVALNRLTFEDADEVRALFSELIGKKVDDSYLLMPPFYTTGWVDISIGRNVFVNQNRTFYDLGGLDIGDDVMTGPKVNIITPRHPIGPGERHIGAIAKPIAIERNVCIAAGETIIGGVTVGEIPRSARHPQR